LFHLLFHHHWYRVILRCLFLSDLSIHFKYTSPCAVTAIWRALPKPSATFNAPKPAGNFKPALSASATTTALADLPDDPLIAALWLPGYRRNFVHRHSIPLQASKNDKTGKVFFI
jgi:hypothetical protein